VPFAVAWCSVPGIKGKLGSGVISRQKQINCGIFLSSQLVTRGKCVGANGIAAVIKRNIPLLAHNVFLIEFRSQESEFRIKETSLFFILLAPVF